jgi:NADH-quinone oxidoreductase subunit D
MDDLDVLLTENRIFKQRNVDIAVVSLDDAWARGFSGVMLRGSGAAWDLRKAQPYECYSELDFDIPIGKHGDCYARYLVRMEEMRQAVRIMKQCLDKLRSPEGQGPVIIEDHRVAPPRRPIMKRSMEAMIEHFKLYTEGFRVPKGVRCCRGAKGRIRSLSSLRRDQPTIQMQNPRPVISAFGGNGLSDTRTHAR